MKHMEYFTDRIEQELDDAKEYAEKATLLQRDHREIADELEQISRQKVSIAEKLHAIEEKYMDRQKQENGSIPEGMRWMFDNSNKRELRKKSDVKNRQDMYRQK